MGTQVLGERATGNLRRLPCLKKETLKSRRRVPKMHEEALEVMPDLPKFEKDAEAEKKLREFLRQFLLTW